MKLIGKQTINTKHGGQQFTYVLKFRAANIKLYNFVFFILKCWYYVLNLPACVFKKKFYGEPRPPRSPDMCLDMLLRLAVSQCHVFVMISYGTVLTG